MICPKCKKEQPDSTTCVFCHVLVEKYLKLHLYSDRPINSDPPPPQKRDDAIDSDPAATQKTNDIVAKYNLFKQSFEAFETECMALEKKRSFRQKKILIVTIPIIFAFALYILVFRVVAPTRQPETVAIPGGFSTLAEKVRKLELANNQIDMESSQPKESMGSRSPSLTRPGEKMEATMPEPLKAAGYAPPTMASWDLSKSIMTRPPNNLLQNPSADEGTNHWRTSGAAEIKFTADRNPHFTVRNRGSFLQDIALSNDAVGKYALLIGRTSSERINADGAITGLPNLYGYMIESTNPERGRILTYLQGQEMLCGATTANEWVTTWGIFQVPLGTGIIRFFLDQAERKNVPQNGSAARFDDLGIYLFNTEKDANAFVRIYKDQKQ